MSELSPGLKELVRASKSTSLPTEADSARIFAALRARLGDAVMGAESPQAATTISTGITLGKVSAIGLVGLALLGGLWFFTARAQRAVSSEANAVPSAATTILAAIGPAPSAAPASAQASPSDVEANANDGSNSEQARRAAPRHARDTLAEEVALLSRAETALHSGKPLIALEVLREHERKFGNGLLKEERIAARVQALCALGRNAEANVQLAQLSPTSLHGEQSRQACNSRKNN